MQITSQMKANLHGRMEWFNDTKQENKQANKQKSLGRQKITSYLDRKRRNLGNVMEAGRVYGALSCCCSAVVYKMK